MLQLLATSATDNQMKVGFYQSTHGQLLLKVEQITCGNRSLVVLAALFAGICDAGKEGCQPTIATFSVCAA